MVLERMASGLSGPPKISGFVLVLANMIPVVGVILWDWKAFDLLAAYWSENVVLGLLNIPRMLLARGGGNAGWPARTLAILLFCAHFSLFCAAHGFFVFAILGNRDIWSSPLLALPRMLGMAVTVAGGAIPAFVLSHLFSFFWNDVGQREYRCATLPGLMFAPYRRAAFLHMAALFGAFALSLLDSPVLPLLALIAAKTALDFGFHLFTHEVKPSAVFG